MARRLFCPSKDDFSSAGFSLCGFELAFCSRNTRRKPHRLKPALLRSATLIIRVTASKCGQRYQNSQERHTKMKKITPFLWFDGKAEEAMKVYVSLFKNA